VSRGNVLDVSGCLRSNLTVWKEDQFTVLAGQGIKHRENRTVEWVAKVLSLAKPGVRGCVHVRAQWSSDEDTHMRPGYHRLCEFGDAGNDTSCVKQFNLSNHTWEDYRDTHFYKGDCSRHQLDIKRWFKRVEEDV